MYAAVSGAVAPITSLPNVVGYGWGVKIKENQITSSDCLTVFVSRKHENVIQKDRIPPNIQVGESRWSTDVVELGRLRLEASALHVRCGNQGGIAGIYASKDGEHYVVSCSHVITGDDSVLSQDDDVYYYDLDWQRLGPAISAYEDRGAGTASEWGAFDAGLARIDDDKLRHSVMSLPLGNVFDHQQDVEFLKENILSKPVYAIRGNGNRIEAQVFAILTNDTARDVERYDLLIRHPDGDGLTRPGDSGIVWRLSDGMPLGIHFGGCKQDSLGVSTIAAAFFVNRVALRFTANLIDPVTR
ncbi:MAG: hypothetical protein HQK58_08950 [Deltaproteobacteria bacterium]|nr:hypothetical protein [Deltaproteobacteria bacterium]